MLTFVRTCDTSACYVTSWVGWCGVGMLTFVRTCDTCACYVTSWVGWGGYVDVRENLRHIRMLRNFLGWVGWGGDVDVRENLRHIRMLCNFLGWLVWGGDVDVRENLRHIRMLRSFLGWVLIRTGGVDSMWKLSKSAIPSSLATRVNGHVNPKLMRSIRIWQWRWMSSKENVLEKTGRMLDKRMCSRKGKNSREFLAQKSL